MTVMCNFPAVPMIYNYRVPFVSKHCVKTALLFNVHESRFTKSVSHFTKPVSRFTKNTLLNRYHALLNWSPTGLTLYKFNRSPDLLNCCPD